MENRILLLGDELFGPCGEAALRFSELLLAKEQTRKLQFILNAPIPYSLKELQKKIAMDVTGKQASKIIVGIGLHEIKTGKDFSYLKELFDFIFSEIKQKSNARIFVLTIPLAFCPEAVSVTEALNQFFFSSEDARLSVFDFNKAFTEFSESQKANGKFARTLLDDTYLPTSITETFLGMFLQESMSDILNG